MTIIIYLNKPPRQETGLDCRSIELKVWLTSYLEEMVLRILGFRKDELVEFLPLKRAGGVFGSEKQISLGLYRQRSKALQDVLCVLGNGGGQHRMVSIGLYDLCLSPRVAKD